jgi:hypothetical protein
LARRQQLHVALVVERLAPTGHPLREVCQMRGDVGDTLSLRGDVEIPRGAHERLLVDDLVQMVHALDRDRRRVAASRNWPDTSGRCASAF